MSAHHWVDVDVSWSGSGRDGDPWVRASWDVVKCYCDRPWRHGNDDIRSSIVPAPAEVAR